VLGLIVAGVAVLVVAGDDQGTAELGGAILSGGIVGGAFVLVERMLNAAARKRNHQDRLRQQLESGEVFPAMNLAGEDLAGLYLPNRVFFGAVLNHANLRDAQLLFGDLRHIEATGASFAGADLSGVNLSNACLSEADFTDANMRDCGLRDADLTGATLRDTVLLRADLSGADLRGADLKGVTLDGVRCVNTRWPDGFEPPESTSETRDHSQRTLIPYLVYQKEQETRKRVRSDDLDPGLTGESPQHEVPESRDSAK
jgi:uncharacterized protein YjbI with pentapeptide repeats